MKAGCFTCGAPINRRSKAFCSVACWRTFQRTVRIDSEKWPERERRKRAYGRWRQMVRRCTDPTHQNWGRYGARGITVCDRWLEFDAYYEDTGDQPDGMTLDRIDNDGPYSLENTRWATPSQQRANIQRDPQASKTHCKSGHAFTAENTHVDRRGWRACRACARAKTARRRALRKEAGL